MRKFLFSLLTLTLIVCLSAFCFVGCNGNNDGDNNDTPTVEVVEGITYTQNDQGTAYSVTTVDTDATIITILDTVNDLPVTTIGAEAFRGQLYIKEIVLPTSVVAIERSAFNGCEKLEKINLENVKAIGDEAFKGAFSDNGIQITATYPKIILSSIESLGNNAFNSCLKLRELDMSTSSITSIAEGAFNSCGLYTVKLPSTVKTIGKSAFMGNSNLVNVNLENVEYFKASCFDACRNLKNPVLTNAIDIRNQAFYECDKLKTVTLGNKVERIYIKAFESVPLIALTIGNATDFEYYYFETANEGNPPSRFHHALPKMTFDESGESREVDKSNPEEWAKFVNKKWNQGYFICTQKWMTDNGHYAGEILPKDYLFNLD